jgi:DNA polymerase elongation subunit (family B)
MRVVSFDVETFCHLDSISNEAFDYLKSRNRAGEGENMALALNPYISHVISASLFYINEGVCEVFYITDRTCNIQRGQINMVYTDVERSFHVVYNPICLDDVLLSIKEGEKELLERLWNSLKDVDLLVTYNGEGFDMPFLKIRTMIHHIKEQSFFKFFPYPSPKNRSINHIDLMRFISQDGKSGFYSLWFVCKAFNIGLSKEPMKGSEVERAFLEGRYDEVAVYNAKDALATGLLYERVGYYLSNDIKDWDRVLEVLGRYSGLSSMVERLVEKKVMEKSHASELIDYLKSLRRKASIPPPEDSIATDAQKDLIVRELEVIERYQELRREVLIYLCRLFGVDKLLCTLYAE